MVKITIPMEDTTRGLFSTVFPTAMADLSIKMETTIRAMLNLEGEMGKATIIRDRLSSMVSSRIMCWTDRVSKREAIIILRELMSMVLRRKEYWNTHKIFIRELSKTMRLRGRVSLVQLKVDTLEDFVMDCSMDTDSFTGKMEVNIEEITAEECVRGTGSSLMLKVKVFAGVFGVKEYWMVWVSM